MKIAMKKTGHCLLFCLLLIPASAQVLDDDSYKPYVTDLAANVKGSYIILTWKNASDVQRDLQVYRYTEKITPQNLEKATKLATLDSAKTSYLHYPEDTREYYFAVMYVLSNGEPNGVLISYRNITSKGVRVTAVGSTEELATKITEISAQASEDSIVVTFQSSKPGRELMLYRNTSPLYTTDDLLEASYYLVLENDTAAYIDYPIPGLDYYYAVLDAELVKTGQIILVRDENTTSQPVRLQGSSSGSTTTQGRSTRSLPLPLLSLDTDLESGSGLINSVAMLLPSKQTLSQETRRLVEELAATFQLQESPEALELEVLAIDKAGGRVGEEQTLQTIITDNLQQSQFPVAARQLETFLQIKRSQELEARAHFYLGQAYYFQENYKKALLEFLVASDKYYAQTQQWIDSCFQFLVQ